MAIPTERSAREFERFVETPSGATAVRVQIGDGSPKFDWDAYVFTQTATEDIYEFKTGGVGGTITATLTITYTDVTKTTEDNVVWT